MHSGCHVLQTNNFCRVSPMDPFYQIILVGIRQADSRNKNFKDCEITDVCEKGLTLSLHTTILQQTTLNVFCHKSL